jgi:hypothetical protein
MVTSGMPKNSPAREQGVRDRTLICFLCTQRTGLQYWRQSRVWKWATEGPNLFSLTGMTLLSVCCKEFWKRKVKLEIQFEEAHVKDPKEHEAAPNKASTRSQDSSPAACQPVLRTHVLTHTLHTPLRAAGRTTPAHPLRPAKVKF